MEQSDNTGKYQTGPRLKGNRKVLLLVGIPLVIGLFAATALFVTNRRNQPVALSSDVVTVEVTSGGYSPQTIKVKKGQIVSWTNRDVLSHRFMADPEKLSGFDNPEFLNQGDTYSYIFDRSGTFNYYDPNDPKEFVGNVIVE